MTSAQDLVDAVASWIERDVVPGLDRRAAYQARVAVHALRIVERALGAGDDLLPDRAELAAAIRDGSQPDDADLRRRLLADVLARIAVDSPDYSTVGEARIGPDAS